MQDWEEIRSIHGPDVWKVIFRIVANEADASDCYQEVFIEAFVKARQSEVKNLPGLLRWLAVRRALDMRRSLKRQHEQMDERRLGNSIKSDPLSDLRFEEMVNQLRHELDSVPLNQAEAFWLTCVEEMTYAEAAHSMGITPKHVGVLVHRARKHLQHVMMNWRVSMNSDARD